MIQPKILAVIPARKGSKGLPNKNVQKLNGHPLIAYSLKAALATSNLNKVIVATDSQEIKESVIKYGGEAPFFIPDKLTGDHVRLEDTFQYIVEKLEQDNQFFDYFCFVDPTRPLRYPGFLDKAIDAMLAGGYDSVISGVKEHKSVWKESNEKLERIDSGFTVRQLKKDKIYVCYSGLITCTKTDFIKKGLRLGEKVLIHEFDDFNMTIDIHHQDDLILAELILKQWPGKYVSFV